MMGPELMAISAAVGAFGSVASGIAAFTNKPKTPKPQIPAAPAPTRRTDTGANVVVGSDAVKDLRVSGGVTQRQRTTVIDPLGGLGGGTGLKV